jgi:hypothetical protein
MTKYQVKTEQLKDILVEIRAQKSDLQETQKAILGELKNMNASLTLLVDCMGKKN